MPLLILLAGDAHAQLLDGRRGVCRWLEPVKDSNVQDAPLVIWLQVEHLPLQPVFS